MSAPTISIRLPGYLLLAFLALCVGMLPTRTLGAPAPKPTIYALFFVPKKGDEQGTIRHRRSQIDAIKSRFTFYAAIRLLKGVDLPSLPTRGKADGEGDSHEADVDWMEKQLKIEYLDGTGVLRIGLTAGSIRDQALLVNAIARAYLRERILRDKERYEMQLEALQRDLKVWQGVIATFNERNGKGMDKDVKANSERTIEDIKTTSERVKFELRILPQLLELPEAPKN